MLVQQPSLESLPQHHRSSRASRNRKRVSPAISNLLSATTIPCPRNTKRRPRLDSNEDSCFSTPSSANSSSLLSLSSRRSSASSSISSNPITSNAQSFFLKPQLPYSCNTHPTTTTTFLNTIATSNSSASTLKDLDLHSEFFSLDDYLSGVVSDVEDDDDDDDENDNDSCFSFTPGSPPDSELSVLKPGKRNTTRGPPSRSPSKHMLTRRASAARLRSNSSVKMHPLAVFDDGYEADDAQTSCNEEAPQAKKKKSHKKASKGFKYQSLVTNLTASFKAISSVATSLSSSHQKLVSSTDVFKFSPRSTDEPIPNRANPRFVEERKGKAESKDVKKDESKASATPLPAPNSTPSPSTSSTSTPTETKPQESTSESTPTAATESEDKHIPLKTYSIEEYALAPIPKGRDYRENSSFLRIYSLENTMKKHGKLSSSWVSKAQVMLLPRKDEIPSSNGGSSGSIVSVSSISSPLTKTVTTLSGDDFISHEHGSCESGNGSTSGNSTNGKSSECCGCSTGNGPFSNTYKYLYSNNHGRVIQPCIHYTKKKNSGLPAAARGGAAQQSSEIEGLDTLLDLLVQKLKVNQQHQRQESKPSQQHENLSESGSSASSSSSDISASSSSPSSSTITTTSSPTSEIPSSFSSTSTCTSTIASTLSSLSALTHSNPKVPQRWVPISIQEL